MCLAGELVELGGAVSILSAGVLEVVELGAGAAELLVVQRVLQGATGPVVVEES